MYTTSVAPRKDMHRRDCFVTMD